MEKNVTVFDSEGKIIGKTYPKRAQGLVKNGRARFCEGSEPAIVLSRSPDIQSSEEDETMSTFSSEELHEKIEAMVREAREKLDAVCRTASDAIDDIVDKIEEGESRAEEAEEPLDAESSDSADGEENPRGRFIRISDEDMEKLRAKMRSLRDSLERAADEAKSVAVKTGAEIGRYAENVKAKVTEKIAEQKAAAEAKADVEKPGTEAYYLRRIEELRGDNAHLEAMSNSVKEYVRNTVSENENMSEAISQIASVASAHEETNRRLLEFYIREIGRMHDR